MTSRSGSSHGRSHRGRPPNFRPRRDRREDAARRPEAAPFELPGAKTARQLAFATLLAATRADEFVTELIERHFVNADLQSLERPLATELTFGVVRRKSTLDALLAAVVSRPRENVEPALWMLLRLGTYQLALCDGVAVHAAVDETVELARWMQRPEWIGFANGVLRGITRLIVRDPIHEPSPKSLPLTNGRYRRLADAVFADPSEKPVAYVAKAFSLPTWLLERWSSRFDFAELCRLGFWFNSPASICLRANRLRSDRESLLKVFAADHISARAGELPQSIWLEDNSESRRDVPTRIDRLPKFDDGWFVVQDESAQRAAELLAPRPGETVLDLCAAPGTKTTHLAELMNNTGRIVATDVREDRLRLVQQNAQRLGLSIIDTAVVSAEGTDIPAGPFDAILIDAPCSNTGVLGKRPDARWRILPEDVEELSRIQLRLLLAAADRVRPGGRIVYSTCSIEPEENRLVVEAACHFRRRLRVIAQHDLIPGQPADGGFQGLLHCD